MQETVVEETVGEVSDTIEWVRSLWPSVRSGGIKLLLAILVFLIGMRLIAGVMKGLDRAAKRTGADETLGRFLHSFIQILLYVLLVFVIAGQMGVNTASLITIIGSGAVAIGLALQDSLSNVAGGILILLMRPFRVGDYIISSEAEGTVREIGLVYTYILTRDRKMISIPNSTLSSISVTNASREGMRRLDVSVGISYDSDILLAKQIVERIYRECPLVLQEEEIEVHVDELGAHSVVIGAWGFVNGPDFLKAKWHILEQIKLSFDREGIVIPFNQLDIHVNNPTHSS